MTKYCISFQQKLTLDLRRRKNNFCLKYVVAHSVELGVTLDLLFDLLCITMFVLTILTLMSLLQLLDIKHNYAYLLSFNRNEVDFMVAL